MAEVPGSALAAGEGPVVFAQGRQPERTYASRGFTINQRASRDDGQPARYVYKVFDTVAETQVVSDGSEWTVSETEGGRYQVRLLVAREAGAVKELWIERVPASGAAGKVKCLLNLRREDAGRLVELLRNLDHIPVEGEQSVRVDDALVRELFADPDFLAQVYRRDPDQFRQLITNDETARDVVAVAHRRTQVEHFRRLLEDPGFFADQEAAMPGVGKEKVWQAFFERNPWILGATLAGQLLTSWSSQRLEQVVAGSSVASVGKRADALMRTAGRINSMVFAEFKTHEDPLLAKEYRSGCWTPSEQLVGGVAQAQGTVHLAVEKIGQRLADQADDGSEIPGRFTYLIKPRSFLVIGRLDELTGQAGGDHQDKVRSFELYRRNLTTPEVITFDELLARAEAYVDTAEAGDGTPADLVVDLTSPRH